jgi:hypothetical protein
MLATFKSSWVNMLNQSKVAWTFQTHVYLGQIFGPLYLCEIEMDTISQKMVKTINTVCFELENNNFT